MIKIGITGGIGSGKSVVSRLLEIMGIPVYISDAESKRLTQTDPVIRTKLCELLGDELFAGGVLNKPMLAAFLFKCPEHGKLVSHIIHPAVKVDFRSWADMRCYLPVVGMESAILVESGFADEVDYLVMVYAPLEVRIRRAVLRDNCSRELIMQRIQSQMEDEEKLKMAKFVIVNDGETPLIPQVLELISFLSKNISYLCPRKNN